MIGYKLEKDVTLYKSQFDKLLLDMYHDYRLDRTSMELDGMIFKAKFMIKHQKDLVMLPDLRDQFTEKTLEVRKIFGEFLLNFICQAITIPEPYRLDNVIDLFANDVKIDPIYVKFQMIVISNNKDFLDYIDHSIPEGTPFNMYPHEHFRFYVDSYNDGIAKAYPELFENRQQDKIGTGDDADVFCHSFTFQTSERCSCNCTYCFAGGTRIVMADGSWKKIEEIQIGDKVLGFKEYAKTANRTAVPTVVKNIFHRYDYYYIIRHPELERGIKVTGNHPVLTSNNAWKMVQEVTTNDGLMILDRNTNKLKEIRNFVIERTSDHCSLYNFETGTHTYIAENLAVHNCYEFNKTGMRMDFETAREFIDNLLADKYGYINRYNSPAIIIEFIGGEPLMEIHLTRKIYEYFLEKCYESNHPWFHLHRLSICSNGMQYFDKDVQDFFKDYSQNISFNISIDGNKELHDACRIQPNGEGTYDIDMMALNHYATHYNPERNSKMTLAPANIKYLYDSVVDFISKGMRIINLNCVFEEGWNQSTAKEEYFQLKKLADYIIDNDMEHIYLSIFSERPEGPYSRENDNNYCGGSGSMLAMRPNGDFYPCIRYMPTSVGPDVPDLCIGNVRDGMDGRQEGSEVLKMLDAITRRSQNNDICYDCPIGNNCASCLALGHTVFGTPDKRATFICIQHIAECLANVYYWNRLNLKHPEYQLGVRKNMVPDEWARLVVDDDELVELKLLECFSMVSTMESASGTT